MPRFDPRLLASATVVSALLSPTVAIASGTIEKHQIVSANFAGNTVGISAQRRLQVYLAPGYRTASSLYPVLYFLHTFFEDEDTFFAHLKGKQLLDSAIQRGALNAVIVVTADFNTPAGGSFYINSPVTGRWRDFMVQELVPFIDKTYRTLPHRNARGLFGHHMGGYGAIRFGARHPEVFGVVYGLHPVATGFGHILMQSRPDWDRLTAATGIGDVKGHPLSEIFTAIYQATLPNPKKPPLYFDAPARKLGEKLVVDPGLIDRLQDRFFLERQVGRYAQNMKSLVALKFDWGRHDSNQDHVYSNQFYSRKLNEYGVPHEAEEYNGGFGDKTFEPGGRIETDVFPFFQAHLAFDDR